MSQISLTSVTLLLLLSVGCLYTHVTAACCTKYSKAEIPIGRIKGYSVQTNRGRCNINAVIFHTFKGIQLCADPGATWVMERIKSLRETVKQMRNKNSTFVGK